MEKSQGSGLGGKVQKSLGWMWGYEPKIEVIVKMQKKSGAEGGMGVGVGGGSGRGWGGWVGVNQELKSL